MYQRLLADRLTGGEEIQIGYVEGPDPEWMSRLIPFLGHKEPWFEYHIVKALSEPLDGLRTRFYVGTVRDTIIANVMVVSAHGAGILGHVYTVPSWRRQHAVSVLMRAQMRAVADLDVITLSAEHGSAAYRIYADFGFRSMRDGSGDMCWLADDAAATRFFEPAECTVQPMRWDDWPLYSWATLQEPANEPLPRSAAFGIVARGSSEGAFVRLMQSSLGKRSSHLILRSARNAVVGWCHVVPGQAPLHGTYLLDLHTVPGFEPYLPTLLANVKWPAGSVVFTMSPRTAAYAAALADVGFAANRPLSDAVSQFAPAAPADVWLRPV